MACFWGFNVVCLHMSLIGSFSFACIMFGMLTFVIFVLKMEAGAMSDQADNNKHVRTPIPSLAEEVCSL